MTVTSLDRKEIHVLGHKKCLQAKISGTREKKEKLAKS
jgi:carbonic anhydrase